MLSSENRLHHRVDFADVVRRGRRRSGRLVTVHLLVRPGARPARVGLVVSKAVGGSVVRSTVARRLRHQVRTLLPDLPAGTMVVLRAAPGAASSTSKDLRSELQSLFVRLLP